MRKLMRSLRFPSGKGIGLLVAVAAVSFSLSARARQTPQQTQQNPSYNRPSMSNFPDPLAGPSPMDPARLQKMREDERRKRLQSDTTKLVELSNQLKEEVDKTSKDELSLSVVRKAAEIEKLAHDVRERMKS